MKKPLVIILLSTYNGEKYIKELIDSILKQTYKNLKILIRDDGSTDSTCDIIKRYSDNNQNITYIKGANLKPAKSFLELLMIAPEADYYAFADQDDVWLPNKIEKGIEALETNNANLYHSNFQLVDSELKPIETEGKPNVNSIEHAAILYPCTGCTMIISKKLRDLVNSYVPQFLLMHDSWIFKIALAVCQPIVFDKSSHILYRQHGGNVLGGIKTSLKKRMFSKLRGLSKPQRTRSKEMNELLNGYSSLMEKSTFYTVNSLANYAQSSLLKRLRLAFDNKFKTTLLSKNILFKLSIITKNY